MSDTFTLPAFFSDARKRLYAKFRKISPDMVDDGIQYACIEYWQKDIASKIPNQNQAVGWFIKVASNYLCNELDKKRKFLSIRDINEISYMEMENQLSASDMLAFIESHFGKNASIVIKHAMGYSLTELATIEHLSINAMKQRHCRGKKTILEKRYLLKE